jgi:hypothetical protein
MDTSEKTGTIVIPLAYGNNYGKAFSLSWVLVLNHYRVMNNSDFILNEIVETSK